MTSNADTLADVKIKLISQIKEDGYLSERMANEVVQKFVTAEDGEKFIFFQNSTEVIKNEAKPKGVLWQDYLSLINFIKLCSVILFLIAFSNVLHNISKGIWFILVKVPIIDYQIACLAFTCLGTVNPKMVTSSDHFYLAAFCSIANIIIIIWILKLYGETIKHFVRKNKIIADLVDFVLKLNVPPSCLISFLGMLYFGSLAVVYHSSAFGFLASVCLSGVFSFGMFYMPGCLILSVDESMLNAAIFGHLIVISMYTFVHYYGHYVETLQYFDAGIQYYCTIAMSTSLLIGSSPFQMSGRRNMWKFIYLAIFVIVFMASAIGYFFLNIKAVASIIFCFFVLISIEWIGYLGYQNGMLIGSCLLGTSLYVLSLFLEKYSSTIILSLK